MLESEIEDKVIIDKLLRKELMEATKQKTNLKPYMWLTGVLFISTGVGIVDYRAGLVVAGLLLLLTVMVSE